MRMIDTGFGGINYLRFFFGFCNRLRHSSKGGRLGPTVRYRVKRLDNPKRERDEAHVTDVLRHLHQHGVPTFDHNFDGYYFYFSVRKTQHQWVKWLYNGRHLRSPKKGWNR